MSNTKSHREKKNPIAHEQWMKDKKVGRPKQKFDPETKTFYKE
jgi:hypothetical protein